MYECKFVLRISQELFIRSTSYLAGGLLGIQGSAMKMSEVIWMSSSQEIYKNTS